jgi:NUMOD4 motif-containing protein
MGKIVKEVWKSVQGYEGFYEVSNLGQVRSIARRGLGAGRGVHKGILLKQVIRKGYYEVTLSVKRKTRNKSVARLVAHAFISNPLNLPQINHKNGKDRLNNRTDNLEWTTPAGNTQHAWDTGLIRRTKPPISDETRAKLRESRRRLQVVRTSLGRFAEGTNRKME